MTTIAARAGVMASDSRETDVHEALETCFVVSNSSKKIWRLPDGRLFGGSDASEDITRLYIALEKHYGPPKLDHVCGLLINLDGSMELYEGNIWVKIKSPFYAIGTGAAYAMAAMHAGATAEKAAAIGAMMDPYSGGRIQVLKVRKSSRIRKR